MPAIPRMVLSDGSGTSFSRSQVAESSEMPPLPVSSIKLRLSGKSPSLPFKRITPPVNKEKEKVVISLEGAGTNSSCARKGRKEKREIAINMENNHFPVKVRECDRDW